MKIENGTVVKIIGGAHKGQSAQMRGVDEKTGNYLLLIAGNIRKVKPENVVKLH